MTPTGPIRPRVLWIVLAWVLCFVLMIVGFGGFFTGAFSFLDGVRKQTPTKTFSSGWAVSVRLDPKDKPVIYGTTAQATDVQCKVVDGKNQTITLTQPSAYHTTITIHDTKMTLLFRIGVPAPGTYHVVCVGEGVRFGIGPDPITALGESASSAIRGLALFTLPFAGFLIAVVVTIVVLVRRSGARKRMMR